MLRADLKVTQSAPTHPNPANAVSSWPSAFSARTATELPASANDSDTMVGVAGRSKGCRTCRRRRVKCDETKPLCTRCLKAGYQCEGYVQYAEFIDVTSQVSSKKLSERGSTSGANATRNVPACSSSSAASPGSYELPLISSSVNLPLNEKDVFITHLMSRLFSWHEDPSSPQSASWIEILLRGPEDETSLSFSSIHALATVYFAKVHRQSSLMRQGARLYSRALQALQMNLQDPILCMEDDLLVAIICLAIYELVAFTQPAGWLHHYKGLARLTIGYLIERKRCFLESLDWKTVPWADCGLGAKTPNDELQDLLCDIPGHVEGVDQFLSWSTDERSKAEFRSALCARIFATLEALYSWRWKWEQEFPRSTYLIAPGGLDPETHQPLPPSPFSSVIWFSDPYRAGELMTYNAGRLIVTRALETIGVCIDTPPSDEPRNDPLLPMQGTRYDVAVEICRMADYHLHSFRRSSGAFIIIFPLNVARLHLDEDDGEIKAWLEKVMSIVADSHGFEVGRRENQPRQIYQRQKSQIQNH
ncbi:hypothetical protein PDE_07029 [Penicillium oxalicum 114-2]|uniref:Zn(2)-C6 fungal-type domain-containing protein n=1 Tax=Penicillium oxalicum (strain 114-2 / CGMCC 5302) TaxID=933388 RepID=S7ZN13_PENO1|nr:hypothetical protein PDE_07029 [Penicillium oxalicum 114-2]